MTKNSPNTPSAPYAELQTYMRHAWLEHGKGKWGAAHALVTPRQLERLAPHLLSPVGRGRNMFNLLTVGPPNARNYFGYAIIREHVYLPDKPGRFSHYWVGENSFSFRSDKNQTEQQSYDYLMRVTPDLDEHMKRPRNIAECDQKLGAIIGMFPEGEQLGRKVTQDVPDGAVSALAQLIHDATFLR